MNTRLERHTFEFERVEILFRDWFRQIFVDQSVMSAGVVIAISIILETLPQNDTYSTKEL